MSLREDLEYNRRVFERLTGLETMPDADSAERSSMREARSAPEWARAESVGQSESRESQIMPAKARAESATVNRYSLSSGVSRETGMALSFEPPAEIEYPVLSERTVMSHDDPLENIYRRMETEARRYSQLTSEEEF